MWENTDVKPMSRSHSILAYAIAVGTLLSGCSGTTGRQTKVYQPGEKAMVEKLTYNIVDTQIAPKLGDDANPRLPQNRFFIVQIAVSNASNKPMAIPSMTLVDDSGKVYNELADGTGVLRWLGIVRNVDPAQTEQGAILFDAPAVHYRLRLTDDTDKEDIYVDLPLNFMHEQMNSAPVVAPDEAVKP